MAFHKLPPQNCVDHSECGHESDKSRFCSRKQCTKAETNYECTPNQVEQFWFGKVLSGSYEYWREKKASYHRNDARIGEVESESL